MSGYALVDLDVHELPDTIAAPKGRTGLAILFRSAAWPLGFVMCPLPDAAVLNRHDLERLAGNDVAERLLAHRLTTELEAATLKPGPALPTLTAAICTKDRPQRLTRLLQSLIAIRETSPFAQTEILVIDNASVDDATRRAVDQLPGVVYRYEPKAGLDFARNAALASASGELLAFLDDDVVVDREWLHGLARAWRSCPGAGGFTGLVLPFRLDTPAQLLFEQRGGFGRGFKRREFASAQFGNALHPVGSGSLGAGCNMAFDRVLLQQLGGFDDALDTGAPLPGGGDLDIFYRVLRSGRRMVYEPSYLVYHEHRETLPQLNRQYWSWGLGFMAFLIKCRRSDPEFHSRHSAMIRWWFVDRLRALADAVRRHDWQVARFVAAETRGGIQGLAGEYDRSLRRVSGIRAAS